MTGSFFPVLFGNGFYLKLIGLLYKGLDSFMAWLLVNVVFCQDVRINILEIEASVNSVLASNIYLTSSCRLYLEILLLSKWLCLILLLVSHHRLLHEEMVRDNLWFASFHHFLPHATEWCLGPIMVVLNYKWRRRAYVCWIDFYILFLSFVFHQLLQNLNAAFLHIRSLLIYLLLKKLLASAVSFLFRFSINFLHKRWLC